MADCGINPVNDLAQNLSGMNLGVGEYAKQGGGGGPPPNATEFHHERLRHPVQAEPGAAPADFAKEFQEHQHREAFEKAWGGGGGGPENFAGRFLQRPHPGPTMDQVWQQQAHRTAEPDFATQFLAPQQAPPQEQSETTRVFEEAFKGEQAVVPKDGDWAREFTEQKVEADFSQQFLNREADFSQQFLNREAEDWAKDFQDIDWKAYAESLYGAKYANPNVQIEEETPEYKFSDNNPYMQDEDPFAKGLRLMKEGNLNEAILAFEAACTKDAENPEPWRYLGQCCAENEDEQRAIASLLKCIELDPYNLDSLLMLGVSFTNELDQSRALEYLEKWITNHPDYQEIAHKDPQQQEFEQFYGGNQHENVTGMFLRAADVKPDDADVHIVLGVLFNLTNEYDRAAKFFENALKIRPDDPSLWNKLGATQANGNHCSEAIEAYRRALSIKPNYVRAYANLGISFSNEGKHFEACQSYLASLEKNPNADHIWSLIKLSLHKLNKPPLVDMADRRDVDSLKKEFNL